MKQFFENLKLSSKQYKSYATAFLLIGIFSILLSLLLLILSAYFAFFLFLALGGLSIYINILLKNNSVATHSTVNNKKSSLKIAKIMTGLLFFELILFLIFIVITPTESTETPQEEVTTQESVGEPIDFNEATRNDVAETENKTIERTTSQIVNNPVDESEDTVYISKTGTKYHRKSNCGKGEYWQVPKSEALEQGLEPCQRCY